MPESLTAAVSHPASASRERLTRIGIIGFGKMGRIRHETVSQHEGARVVAVCDPHQALRLRGVRLHETPEQLLRDPEVDAVFICTPNHLNQPLTIKALEAGKHVFCE